MTTDTTIAHIVHPASKLREIESGKKQRVKSLCGAFITGHSQTEAPICRKCFVIYNESELVNGEEAER